ncbi:hypothetical protein [Alloalcanivorax xenomutans]|uniref:hypothetical protein n=2 Tax=Alloalcanivorax xenomutans TaxID=1094342 RepID=UPI0007A74C4D|nr:hypothetical protein [Alloalcanivorax xenomutans]KYZ85004.1 hypothetical protein A3Q32_07080 [Alcanivorax sp. KX64203]
MKIYKSEPWHGHNFLRDRKRLIDKIFFRDERPRSSLNRWMFDEDFSRLFHYSNRRSDNLFEISSNDDELAERLLGGVQTRYMRNSIGEIILNIVEDIAKSLICFGRAYYFLYEDADPAGIRLVSFGPVGVFSVFGINMQWVPRRPGSHWDQESEERLREIRVLNKENVLHFKMPMKIRRILCAQNKTLAALDENQDPGLNFYHHATHENPNPVNHFDFSVWNEAQECALYRATKGTGWNGRKYDSSKRSDFFDCHRLIRFRRNQIFLRDDILRQIGGEITRIGRGYDTEFSIRMSASDGLPSIEYLNELEVKLMREEVGFDEVIDYCYKR